MQSAKEQSDRTSAEDCPENGGRVRVKEGLDEKGDWRLRPTAGARNCILKDG